MNVNNIERILLSENSEMIGVGLGKLSLTTIKLIFERNLYLLGEQQTEIVYSTPLNQIINVQVNRHGNILNLFSGSIRKKDLVVRNRFHLVSGSRETIKQVKFTSLDNPSDWVVAIRSAQQQIEDEKSFNG